MEAGAQTLKEAVSAAIRDWVASVGNTHYVIGSAVGPAPYPALVRDLQRVIGDEARSQAIDAEGELPAPGDRLRRRRLELDRDLLRLPRRPGGADRGRGRGRGAGQRAPWRLAGRRARPASSTARSHPCSPTSRARSSRPTRSPPVSTIPASGPSTPSFATAAAPSYFAVTDDEAIARLPRARRLEGIIPALEPAHAIAWLLENGGGDGYDVLCLSRTRRQGHGRGDGEARRVSMPDDGHRQIGSPSAFARRAGAGPRRADAVHDGRLPGPGGVALRRRGLRGRGRRPDRARRAVLGSAR